MTFDEMAVLIGEGLSIGVPGITAISFCGEPFVTFRAKRDANGPATDDDLIDAILKQVSKYKLSFVPPSTTIYWRRPFEIQELADFESNKRWRAISGRLAFGGSVGGQMPDIDRRRFGVPEGAETPIVEAKSP